MSDQLNVEKRDTTGTLRMRRLRASGKVPAVLYGHGEETIALQIPTRDVDAAIRHGSHIVELRGALNESALIKEVQWDTFGTDVLHLDLNRVSAKEKVDVTIPVELVGEAPGTKTGGIVNHILHEVEINCPANVMPEKLEIKINDLELDQAILASELDLPAGATLNIDSDQVVVQCELPQQTQEPEEGEATAAEPEVIGQKSDDEDSDD